MKYDVWYSLSLLEITITSHERVTRPSLLHDELSREYYEQSRKHEEQSQGMTSFHENIIYCNSASRRLASCHNSFALWMSGTKNEKKLSIKVEHVLKKRKAQLTPKNTLLTQPKRCRSSALQLSISIFMARRNAHFKNYFSIIEV